ncbi:MAG: glycine oxidase ThiO [bacterium]
MKPTSDVIIIGAGLIGCAIAHRLASSGLQVTVVEKGQPGEEASRAAAGMLAPQAEDAHGLQNDMNEFCFASHALYPEFVEQIAEESGLHVGYQTSGSIYAASDYTEAKMLAGLFERQIRAHKKAEELTPTQLKTVEPALADSAETAVFLPDDHFVNNRQLLTALVTAASRKKVKFLSNTPVLALEIQKDKVDGVHIPGGILRGHKIIIAAGSWSGLIDCRERIVLPVRPIRGQIVCLQVKPQPLRHLIHSSGCYLVPWPDGRILVGSTVENVGYNKQVSAEGVQQLLHSALKIIPALASATVADMWAGLRPDTPDNLPILGETALDNLLVASGHFRNGILLAPLTAKLIAELIVSGKTSLSLQPFRADRFDD